MTKDVGELVDILLKKTDSVYVPTGTVKWRLPTGVPSLDRILGGGIPSGSITQIIGPSQSGKTSLAYRITGEAVKRGYSTLLVPIESYSEAFARTCGIDIDAKNYHPLTGDFAEIIFNTCIEAIREYGAEVIVMDSIAAAIPRADLEKKQKIEDGDPSFNVGTRARAISAFIHQLLIPLKRHSAMFITVNRLTASINRFGGGLTASGGETMKYDNGITINMWGKPDRDTGVIESNVVITKGKEDDVKEFKATTLYFSHGVGVDVYRDITDTGVDLRIIKKAGAWFSYGDKKFQGASGFAEALKADKELYDEIVASINSTTDAPIEEKEEEE